MLFRRLSSLAVAAVVITAAATTADADREWDAGGVEDRGEGPSRSRGWRAITGLRVEQWIAPVSDHLRFDVRLSLPEMALGQNFSIETFKWERLDIAEGRSVRGDNGTVYHLLGGRYRRDAGSHAYFFGAHLFSWSGHARPLAPWLGFRLGSRQGPSIAAEVHLLGLGPAAGELRSPLDDADATVAIDGPLIGPCRVGARGRARDVSHPDRHQSEQMMSLGVGFSWGRRRLFLGLGVQHQIRRAAAPSDEAPAVMPAAPLMLPGPARSESTAIMVHLDAETPLPRSLLAP